MSASTGRGEISTHKSFCRFCHACCAIEVDVVDGRVVKVRGDRDNPIFRGYTCIKGRELPAQHNHPDRLRSSLRRTGDGFEPISACGSSVSTRASRSLRDRPIFIFSPYPVKTPRSWPACCASS
jgi:predicted molibdopterin-dependent oxidoreductase YjgC